MFTEYILLTIYTMSLLIDEIFNKQMTFLCFYFNECLIMCSQSLMYMHILNKKGFEDFLKFGSNICTNFYKISVIQIYSYILIF